MNLQEIAEKYEYFIGLKPSPYICGLLRDYIDELSWGVVEQALDASARAPRPSWAYLEAILRRCEREGIDSEDKYIGEQMRRAGKTPKSFRNLEVV